MKLLLALFLVCSSAIPAFAQSATVTWDVTYQTIDGFGASDAELSQPALSSAQSTFLFSPTSGLGLSILRVEVPDDGSCTSLSEACATGPHTNRISDMQAAVANGAVIFATSWSPPAGMKTNGSIVCNASPGNGALASDSYAAFATYQSNYIASLNNYYKIPVYAISVQNEPDNCPGYEGARMSPSEFDTYVKTNLGPTLTANGQSSTKIMEAEPESHADFMNFTSTCMADPACAAYVGINAFHGYDYTCPTCGTSISNPYSTHIWETEVSDASGYGYQTCSGGAWCPGISDALVWANYIDANMNGGVSAWLWWQTQQYCTGNPWPCNSGLYGTDNKTIAIRAYVIGQYARFVRPGWVRIGATHAPQSGVTVTAYKNASTGTFAIVATNQNTSSMQQTFAFSGVSPSSVTPTTTSATQSLAGSSSVPLSGDSFTYMLPAQSVVTFTGEASSSSVSQNPTAPTALTVSVR